MEKQGHKIGWGIVGTGAIANQFVSQLIRHPEVMLQHVVSSSASKAAMFAKRYGVQHHGHDINALLEDAAVAVVYLATPTRLHFEQASAVLESGKAVLCEKPITTTPMQMAELSDKAIRKGCFCMEGMWMRFNPLVVMLRQLIVTGKLGSICNLRADIGYKVSATRLLDPARGPVWDYAVYPLSLFQWVFGETTQIIGCSGSAKSSGTLSAALSWGNANVTATINASIAAELSNSAVFCGDHGMLELTAPFFCSSRLYASAPLFSGSRISAPIDRMMRAITGKSLLNTRFQRVAPQMSGFYYQAAEVNRCVRAGLVESKIVPHADSQAVIRMACQLQDTLSHD